MSSNLDDLIKQLKEIQLTSLPDENSRARLLLAAQGLCQRIETPFEWVQRMTWQEPTLNLCLQLADDLHLFQEFAPGEDGEKTTTELAASCGADPALLARILRHLAAKGIIAQVIGDRDSYRGTEFSRTLASPEGSSGIRQLTTLYAPLFRHVPDFLKSTNYKEPRDNRNGPFQAAIAKPGQTYFEWIHEPQNADTATDFDLLMRYTTQFRKNWTEVFAPDALFRQGNDPGAPLLVDIGGGTGTDVIEFRQSYPDVHGRVILQELPSVISSTKKSDKYLASRGIECQVHDFFQPEPIIGARIYFLGSVLHDWPDEEARKILRNIVPAMSKTHSTLLLSENVIPANGCHPHLSALDLTMMLLFGSRERTEEHWRELLHSEGLELVHVHTIPSCSKSVLQVRKL